MCNWGGFVFGCSYMLSLLNQADNGKSMWRQMTELESERKRVKDNGERKGSDMSVREIAEHLPSLNWVNPLLFHGWISHNQYAWPQALSQSVLPSSIPLSQPHDSVPILLTLHKPRVDGPQTASPSFRGSRHSWSWVLPENSCLQWPREIGNRALRKGKQQFMLALSPGNREVGRLFQKHHLVSTLN